MLSESEIARIRSIAVFSDLPDAALAQLVQKARMKKFPAGAKVLSQGEQSSFALILIEGEVSVVNESQHGQAPLAHVSAPALIGEIGALAHLTRTASVIAASEVQTLRLDRDVLLDVCRHAPDVLVSVIGRLGQQIQSVNNALGLYAGGFAALERGDLSDALAAELSNPTDDLRSFSAAFSNLAQRISQERRTRSEMASAALIQREMLPREIDFPALAGRCDLFGDMKPAREVGGDLFDIVMLSKNRIAIAIGDVCGKGVPASLFMCVTVTMLRLAARQRDPLGDMIEKVNALLCAQNPSSLFTTLFYGVLDLSRGRLEYVNCGHNPPFHRGVDDVWTALPYGGAPLGIVPDKRWPTATLDLAPGEGVFLFTDGVTEAIDRTGAEYGDDRLAALLNGARGDARGLVRAVMDEVEKFADGAEPFDDITCLAALMP